jgi:hypothetical protein
MDEPQLPIEETQDDSLANRVPEPVRDSEDLHIGIVQGGLIACAVLGGVGLLVGSRMNSTLGATRSAKLKWEQRQVEIDQVQQNARLACNEDNR